MQLDIDPYGIVHGISLLGKQLVLKEPLDFDGFRFLLEAIQLIENYFRTRQDRDQKWNPKKFHHFYRSRCNPEQRMMFDLVFQHQRISRAEIEHEMKRKFLSFTENNVRSTLSAINRKIGNWGCPKIILSDGIDYSVDPDFLPVLEDWKQNRSRYSFLPLN